VGNNYFINNQATSGGAAYINSAPVNLQNNVFSGNYALNNGGATYFEKTITDLPKNWVTIINNSFSGNKADQKGGAIYTGPNYAVKPLIINSILWGDTAITNKFTEIYMANTSDSVEIASSDFHPYLVHGHIIDGLGNFLADPLFTNSVYLIPSLGSPVIDKGIGSYISTGNKTYLAPAYDITGLSRPWGLGYDVGAYEYGFVGTKWREEIETNTYPNPFTNSVNIRYTTDKAEVVLLQVFDNCGRMIEELVNSNQLPGEYQVSWNASDRPSGVYYCRLKTGEKITTTKIVKIH
jgi:predicted outer membrane repeat protein